MNRDSIRLRVPASTSNLGSGFDTVSAALTLYLTVEATPCPSGGIVWATPWPEEKENLLDRALRETLAYCSTSIAGLELAMDNPIPLARGLGSSGAAIVAGIKLGERLAGRSLSRDEILQLAYPLEGHPDNLAASLLGGWVLSRIEDGRIRCERIDSPLDCRFVLAVPELEISTREAREILPSAYSLEDAVFNLQRCALLVHALHAGRPELLREALRDRLHQPYRQHLVPGLKALLERQGLDGQLDPHLLGVALSDSGSAVVAFTAGREQEIGEWMQRTLGEAGVEAELESLGLDQHGPAVE